MKNILKITLSLLILSAIFTSCSNSTNTANNISTNNKSIVSSNEMKLNNKTVNIEKSYDINDIKNKKVIYDTAVSDFLLDYTNLESLIENSTFVIKGKINNVEYTSFEGLAWMKTDVTVTQSLKGELAAGDVISVFMRGGYVSLEDEIKYDKDGFRFKHMTKEEIRNTVIKTKVDGEAFPKAGDERIFLLNKTSNDSPLPQGSYQRVCGKFGNLAITDNGKTLTRDIGETAESEKETISFSDFKLKIKK